jgi:amino acid transporter
VTQPTKDVVLGTGTFITALVYYRAASAIPETALADQVGPGGLPGMYAAVLAVLSAFLLAQALGSRRSRPGPDTAVRAPKKEARASWRVGGLLLVGVLYVAAAPSVGYVPALIALIAAATYLQGGAPARQLAAVAVCGAIVLWAVFVVLLGIPQPPGIWAAFF